MSVHELKKQLHKYIELIENVDELMILTEEAEAFLFDKTDPIDLLTPEQLQHLDESIKQADEGILISHEEVLKKSREWHKI